jgi:hypothetical protein
MAASTISAARQLHQDVVADFVFCVCALLRHPTVCRELGPKGVGSIAQLSWVAQVAKVASPGSAETRHTPPLT